VERQSARPVYADGRQAPGPWQVALGRLGRLALGTSLAGSAAAAVLYFAMAPGQDGKRPLVAEVVSPRVAGVLPYGGEFAETEVEERAPRLVVSRKQTELPDGTGPAFDFTLRLENATHGTARFNLIGDTRSYHLHEIRADQPRSLQVPFAAADASGTISLFGSWTGGGQAHTKYLFVPVPSSEGGRQREERQSFGLPRMTIPEAAREIAARYGRPVTLEDVPEGVQIELIARGDTAGSVLRHGLAPLGLRVAASPSGILVSPAPDKAATASVTPQPVR